MRLRIAMASIVAHKKDAYYAESQRVCRCPCTGVNAGRYSGPRGGSRTEMEAAGGTSSERFAGLRTAAILMAVDESLDDRAGVVALQLAARGGAGAVAIEHDTGAAVVFS